MAHWNFDEEIDALVDEAVRGVVCPQLNYSQCRMGYPCGRANQGRCGWGGREIGCRCYGDDVQYPPPQTRSRRGLIRYWNRNDLMLDEIDSMIDEAVFRPSIPGGRPGSVRQHLSPWLSLLRGAQLAIRASANAHASSDSSRFLAAITRAENLLRQANEEIGRVMSGNRLNRVREMIGNAAFAIASAREARRTGRSIFTPGQSLLGVEVHLGRAQNAVQAAINEVGLQRL